MHPDQVETQLVDMSSVPTPKETTQTTLSPLQSAEAKRDAYQKKAHPITDTEKETPNEQIESKEGDHDPEKDNDLPKEKQQEQEEENPKLTREKKRKNSLENEFTESDCEAGT